MEQTMLEEVSKLQSEPNVTGVLISDNKGLCIFHSGEGNSDASGHITYITNQISKIDDTEPYPTILLKSENRSCIIKGCKNSSLSIIYKNK